MITLGRIIAIPGIVALFYLDSPLGQWLACGLFTIAALTDFLDGYLARAWSQQSAFGKFLDPVADNFPISVSLRSAANFLAIMPVPKIPHRSESLIALSPVRSGKTTVTRRFKTSAINFPCLLTQKL